MFLIILLASREVDAANSSRSTSWLCKRVERKKDYMWRICKHNMLPFEQAQYYSFFGVYISFNFYLIVIQICHGGRTIQGKDPRGWIVGITQSVSSKVYLDVLFSYENYISKCSHSRSRDIVLHQTVNSDGYTPKAKNCSGTKSGSIWPVMSSR